MFKQWVSVIVLSGLAAPAVAEDKTDALARDIGTQFMTALKAEDVDAVMKAAAVPFFMDGKRNIQKLDELRHEFANAFDKKDLTQIDFTIKDIQAFEKVQDRLGEKNLELLKDVLTKDDRVLQIEIKSGNRTDILALMVRINDGKAKVVGLRD